MDIKTYLAEQGLSAEEISAVVGNEKTAKAMTAALSRYEEGNTLSAQAKAEAEAAHAEREEAAKFWEEKVTPALANVDKRVATADSETARYKAYLTSLKSQGYDVPDDLVTKTATPTDTSTNTNSDYLTRDEFNKGLRGTAPSLVTLTSLSNQYADLYGKPYVDIDADFEEASKAGKQFRTFVADKYKFADKKKERDAAAEQTRINGMVAEQMKAKEAELAAKYGGNDNLRTAMPSKFDKIEKIAEHKDSWKSSKTRLDSQKDRLSRFENAKFMQ